MILNHANQLKNEEFKRQELLAHIKKQSSEETETEEQALYRKLKFRYSLRLRIDKKESDYRALKSLNHVTSMLQISDSIRDRAAYIYQKAVKKIDKKISNHIVLVAACLFFAIREYKELG